MGICLMLILFGSLAILFKKIKNRANSSSVHPEQHSPHQQNQGYNCQAGNATIVNVMGIIYVTIVLSSIYVPIILAALKIIPPHPLFMVNTFYGAIYVPSLVIPITYAIIWPKSIKIGIQTFPCFN
jgi:cytochrome c biogenesis factor